MSCGIFYYWNANPTVTGIKLDLKAVKAAGFDFVCFHPMPDEFHKQTFFCGMKYPYLGKKYFTLLKKSIALCRELGLQVMLYDEGGWPSGSVLDSLVKKYPECRVKSYVKDKNGRIITQYEDIPDLLDKRTVRHFIEMTHELYFRELKEEFGKTITAIFTDEPFWTGQPGWEMVRYNDSFPGIFRKKYGVSFKKDILPLIFDGSAEHPGAENARRMYLEVCSELFSRNYSVVIAHWCRKHHIALAGHLDSEDTFFISGSRCGNLIRRLDPFDIPGIDAIARQIYPFEKTGYFARFASAAAIRNRREKAIAEVFNVYGYGITPQEMAWISGSLLISGINCLAPMPYLYSDRGKHKICCSTDFSPRIPQWDAMKELTSLWNWAGDFNAGALDAPVWVLARTESPTVERNIPLEKHEIAEKKVLDILQKLSGAGIFYRLADISDLDSPDLPELLIVPSPVPEAEEKLGKLACRVEDHVPDDIARYGEVKILAGKGVEVLPCIRKEGFCLMLWNSGEKSTTFTFENQYLWEEIPAPSDMSYYFAPVKKTGHDYSLLLASGQIRILKRGGRELLPEKNIAETLELPLSFSVVRQEKMTFSLTGKTGYQNRICNIPLPESGNFCEYDPEFSGKITLTSAFDAPLDGWTFFSFERAAHCAEVMVNGKSYGTRAFAPWVFKIKVKKGLNKLKIKISSTAGNEFRRFFKEELQPVKWVNALSTIVSNYTVSDAECGIFGKFFLTYINAGDEK